MRLKEAIEESDIIKAQTKRYLFDLKIRDLQLRLSVCDYRFDDDVAGGTISYGLDGRA